MNYSNLEDAYGTPFGSRAPVTKEGKDDKPLAAPTKPDQVAKHKELVESVKSSLPLDTDKETSNFAPIQNKYTQLPPSTTVQRMAVRENFTSTDDDKLARILKLIEQNRTGYETSSTQDMFLYVVTGVIFLFTFDTFVSLGKIMQGRRFN